jgi:hypothetical protein
METAEHREPYESRGSRTDLGAPGGESPPGDSTLGFLGDVLHVPVRTSITTHDVFFQGGTAELKTNMGTGLVIYRLLDQPTQSVDAGLGFRGWGFNADVSLNPGLLAGQTVNRGSGWGDPLIGGRYRYDFGNGSPLRPMAISAASGSARMSTGR